MQICLRGILEKGLAKLLQANNNPDGGIIYAYRVHDPERYGVVEFNSDGQAISIEEKPEKPKSNFAVTGLYFFDNKVVEYSKKLKPSKRGEIEIVDLLNKYKKTEIWPLKIKSLTK